MRSFLAVSFSAFQLINSFSEIMDTKEARRLLIQDLKDEIACGICFLEMRLPKSLTCMHTYCLSCLEVLSTENGVVACPQCRKETEVKNGDPSLLPTAFMVNRIADILDRYEAVVQRCGYSGSDWKTVSADPPEPAEEAVCQNGDALVKQFRQRKTSLPAEGSRPEGNEEDSRGRRRTHPMIVFHPFVHSPGNLVSASTLQNKGVKFDVILEKTCSKDDHSYYIKSTKTDFAEDESIEIFVNKRCRANDECSARVNGLNAVLTNPLGADSAFNMSSQGNSCWLLSCKPPCEGKFAAVVKADERVIFASDFHVSSHFTAPIDV